jgi:hypothetical protein
MQINTRHEGRGFYFRDDDGHSWEFITHTYIREQMTGDIGRPAAAATRYLSSFCAASSCNDF